MVPFPTRKERELPLVRSCFPTQFLADRESVIGATLVRADVSIFGADALTSHRGAQDDHLLS